MNVLIVSSEVVPFAKTGGLADVTGTLPKELRGIGVDADCILPYYRAIREGNYDIDSTGIKVKVPIGNRVEEGEVLKLADRSGVDFFFVKNDRYFDRDYLYATKDGDYVDNAERFIFFARAVLEFLIASRAGYHVIHCNDWQSGLIPAYLKTLYGKEGIFEGVGTVFTIHNLGYQGLFWSHDMPLTGLGWELFTPKTLEFYGKINFLKAGLIFSDLINTVSETYSKEIQREEFGFGLEGVLFERRADLRGIINGVDYNIWDPSVDGVIARHYSPEDIEGKRECKKDLLKVFGMESDDNTPVVGIISRLVAQKGFDIVHDLGDRMASLDLKCVVLGTGERKYENFFQEMASKYPEKMAVKITYSDEIAHKLEAGSDMFLMPSKYEPCGLNQIYSLRYGTVPVVRNTGGLADTVVDVDNDPGNGTGFKFDEYSPDALLESLLRSLSWYQRKDDWKGIMKRGMNQDFSWQASALKYRELYRDALAKRGITLDG